ncbi:MAG TPA: multifunctional oxoglutarate decarboxylase/oxoglutarate dehydrogenase thiamine pyrophosphate-binding subunit/dihydrolipoyllysine-residue succinyltransferase subunit [Actinomycetota bacterium]|nr:multifunctional oxoglutarate decarboxylase/oxoglutarate dehydrogenase thiamine pyrophosphate-binding subunit/dihydrolipoyllysine-residue succinyltransferase subunit [Actinomycetota bacterium]
MADVHHHPQRERTGFGPNAWLADELYGRFLVDPTSVPADWRAFFETDRNGNGDGPHRRTGSGAPSDSDATDATPRGEDADGEPRAEPLRGAAAVIARRMDESLAVPTATSVRHVPAKLLELNRRMINRHLEAASGSRVSFTHLIGFAIVRAIEHVDAMRRTYAEVDGSPAVIRHDHVGLGLAVDVARKDGTRTLLVPVIKDADTLDFAAFHAAYEELIAKVRAGSLAPDDFAGTTVTLTNPGTIGTSLSVPRLMPGQAAIVGVGAISRPAAFEGADPGTVAELGISKTVTLTNTYDHRVIQGAESGEFLARVHDLLLGEDHFYGTIFGSLGMPNRPIHWTTDARPSEDSLEAREKQARVLQFINNYRVRGHLIADLDPLATRPAPTHPELDPANLGFTIWDLDRRFVTGGLAGTREATLGEIWDVLRDAYTGTLSVEYMHIQDPEQKAWIQHHVEGGRDPFSPEDRRKILTELNEAEAFEHFLHRRYVGHKRFSLEGAESLIPAIRAMLDEAADDGVREAVIGMSHRGRLNVLANVLGKGYGQIFREFEGDLDPDSVEGSGDVKYHLGATGIHRSAAGADLPLTLASNPSHLESVDPVVEGMARAKLDALGPHDGAPVLPVLIHGEAAFAGQGVVAETLSLSQLPGYRTGGTIHLIVNNQLGFTTPPQHGRSSVYASDLARTVQAPVFHVNGDDPEACVRAAQLAYAFRQTFGRDVVIDMWCYRRWGHNETDEPSFTQPLMYRAIAELPPVRTRYTERLVARGELSQDDADAAMRDFSERLQRAFDETRTETSDDGVHTVERRPPAPASASPPMETGVPRQRLDEIAAALTRLPDGFEVHPKLAAWLDQRRTQLGADAVDWAFAEALAFGSLVLDGIPIRLTGQDTRRGTFSQRHAVLVDQRTGDEFFPLDDMAEGRTRAFVYDSLLSEFAAMGFEYGYSVANPDALVLWEAQFGDFVNGAQVVIDQYLVAAEDKWAQRSGLVLLLPHGYEGQGPEHSSARLERFLTLAAEDNIEVAVPSSAAQYFHLLRRQALRPIRKPLVVATPKSFLRAQSAASPAAELTSGSFRPVLRDPTPPEDPSRIVLCQGKLFHELAAARAEHDGVMLVRLERCYPFPGDELRDVLDGLGDREVVWAQEEPENMGAARFVIRNLRERLAIPARTIARPESASPATGSLTLHKHEQQALIDEILAPAPRHVHA